MIEKKPRKPRIRWKKTTFACIEGYVNGEVAFSVEGSLCVTDLRKSRASGFGKDYIPPDHYRIENRDHGKQIAKDLLDGVNFELHEANRLKWLAEQERSAAIIAGADALIKELKALNKNG